MELLLVCLGPFMLAQDEVGIQRCVVRTIVIPVVVRCSIRVASNQIFHSFKNGLKSLVPWMRLEVGGRFFVRKFTRQTVLTFARRKIYMLTAFAIMAERASYGLF